MKLSATQLQNVLLDKTRSQREKLLVILSTNDGKAKSTSEIRAIGVAHGLRSAKTWKPSSILAGGPSLAVLLADGWQLTAAGLARVQAAIGATGSQPTAKPARDLRTHLQKIRQADTHAFLSEAVSCLEGGHLRAAVVLSWVGAVSQLYEHVVKTELSNFNAEALRRDPKWKLAKTVDDLARMKEHEFLNVLEALSILGKNVKAELQHALSLRNACGHPNSLKIGNSRVAAHIEVLLLNVFEKY